MTNALCAGGAENFVTQLALSLQKHAEVGVLTYVGALDAKGAQLAEQLRSAGVKLWMLNRTGRWSKMFAPIEIARVLREYRPDVVNVHLEHSELLVSVAGPLAMSDAVFVRTLHSTNINVRMPAVCQKWIRRFYRFNIACGPDVLTSPSLQLPRKRSIAISNGIALPPMPVDRASEKRAMRERIGLPLDRVIMVNIGSMTPWCGVLPKAQDVILDAFAASGLKESAELVLVGDGLRRKEFERRAEQLGIAEGVCFTGIVPDVAPYIRAADVALLPSRFEGLPLAGLECVTLGLPLIASDISVLDVFDQPGTVRCVAGDSANLAQVMRLACEGIETLAPLAQMSAEHYRARYDMERCAREYYELYSDLVDRKMALDS